MGPLSPKLVLGVKDETLHPGVSPLLDCSKVTTTRASGIFQQYSALAKCKLTKSQKITFQNQPETPEVMLDWCYYPHVE